MIAIIGKSDDSFFTKRKAEIVHKNMFFRLCGEYRSRTDDLLHAMQAL